MVPEYGEVKEVKSGRNVSTLFIKKKPDEDVNPADVTQDDYKRMYHKEMKYTINNVGKRCLSIIEDLQKEFMS